MNIPDKAKIKCNQLVVFEKCFNFENIDYNAVCLTDGGDLLFINTDYFYTPSKIEVAYYD